MLGGLAEEPSPASAEALDALAAARRASEAAAAASLVLGEDAAQRASRAAREAWERGTAAEAVLSDEVEAYEKRLESKRTGVNRHLRLVAAAVALAAPSPASFDLHAAESMLTDATAAQELVGRLLAEVRSLNQLRRLRADAVGLASIGRSRLIQLPGGARFVQAYEASRRGMDEIAAYDPALPDLSDGDGAEAEG